MLLMKRISIDYEFVNGGKHPAVKGVVSRRQLNQRPKRVQDKKDEINGREQYYNQRKKKGFLHGQGQGDFARRR